MDGTRRLLWWEAMAGGMGGFFGFYNKESSAFVAHPYPKPEQLRTHYTFWHVNKRFLLDMRRANALAGSGVYVLKDGERDFVLWLPQTEFELRVLNPSD